MGGCTFDFILLAFLHVTKITIITTIIDVIIIKITILIISITLNLSSWYSCM